MFSPRMMLHQYQAEFKIYLIFFKPDMFNLKRYFVVNKQYKYYCKLNLLIKKKNIYFYSTVINLNYCINITALCCKIDVIKG